MSLVTDFIPLDHIYNITTILKISFQHDLFCFHYDIYFFFNYCDLIRGKSFVDIGPPCLTLINYCIIGTFILNPITIN